jgi:hypothetical protein
MTNHKTGGDAAKIKLSITLCFEWSLVMYRTVIKRLCTTVGIKKPLKQKIRFADIIHGAILSGIKRA